MSQVANFGFFPFCALEVSDGPYFGQGTEFPIGLTFEELFYLYWKVKTIKFESSENLSVSNSVYHEIIFPPPFPDANIYDPTDLAGGYSKSSSFDRQSTSNESGLVCPKPFTYSFTDDLSATSITISFDQVYVVKGTPDLYYIPIVVSSAFHASSGGDLSGLDQINRLLSNAGWPNINYLDGGGSCSIDLFGTSPKTITMGLTGISFYQINQLYTGYFTYKQDKPFFYINGDDANPPFTEKAYSFDATATTSLSITVDATWPYNP